MLEITSHPAIQKGLVTIEHTIPVVTHEPGFSGNRRLLPGQQIDREKIKYLVLNPHGPSRNFEFPLQVEKYLPQDKNLWQDYVNSENDPGIYELTQYFLDMCPGGLAVTVEPTRGLIDANRAEFEFALRSVLDPKCPATVKRILGLIHRQTLDLINIILKDLSPETEILDLHSMEHYSTPNQPPLRHNNIRNFLDAYKSRKLNSKTRRKVDLVTGQNGQPAIADMQMNIAVAELLFSMHMPFAVNEPYDSGPKYCEFKYMTEHPDRVFCVDFRKTDLCKGSVRKRTFDTTKPIVDKEKVRNIGQILVEAWKKVSFNRANEGFMV